VNHSEAMGNVAPPLTRSDAGIITRIRSMLAEEAAVSRALGEQPQPPLWVGVALLSALSLIAFLWLIAVVSVAAPAGSSSSPAPLHSFGTGAAEATGDRP